ncbi:hypothetical protein FQA39_LY03891 [Lamprigera yunnana]|nr:hypothetical protein FQA39_LY03891 [Lamprigera yunnana]
METSMEIGGYRTTEIEGMVRLKQIQIGTWNIISITEKECELTEKMQQYDLKIIDLRETKNQRNGGHDNIEGIGQDSVNEATVNVVTTLESVNLEYFL